MITSKMIVMSLPILGEYLNHTATDFSDTSCCVNYAFAKDRLEK